MAFLKRLVSNKIVEYLNKKKVYVSTKGKATRLSPHLYNFIDDISNATEEDDRVRITFLIFFNKNILKDSIILYDYSLSKN